MLTRLHLTGMYYVASKEILVLFVLENMNWQFLMTESQLV